MKVTSVNVLLYGPSFEIEWAADYDIGTLTELVNSPDNPMAFKFNDLK
jgi:hypothetical protein